MHDVGTLAQDMQGDADEVVDVDTGSFLLGICGRCDITEHVCEPEAQTVSDKDPCQCGEGLCRHCRHGGATDVVESQSEQASEG